MMREVMVVGVEIHCNPVDNDDIMCVAMGLTSSGLSLALRISPPVVSRAAF